MFELQTNSNPQPSNLPNLRRLFVESRTEAEESSYSRKAVGVFFYYTERN